MSDVIKLVQGDSRPQLQLTITNENTGLPVDISGATVRMKFRAAGATGYLALLTGAVVSGSAGTCVINWASTTLDVDEGDYEGEVEVTFADTTIQTVYKPLKFRLRADF